MDELTRTPTMDLTRILEIAVPIIICWIGIIWRDRLKQNTIEHRVNSLEKEQGLHREETSKLNDTLVSTNQRLASLDATMQGLTGWIKRIDERQYNNK